MHIESAQFIGVPEIPGFERPDPTLRFHFRYLSGDRVEVNHPFHGTVTLGDRSCFADPAIDDASVILFQEHAYLVGAMKLSRPRSHETREFAGEYAELSHCLSTAVMAKEFGGGPLDIIDALYNDAAKGYGGHQNDDNYQPHGTENMHDLVRPSFFERSGTMARLEEARVLQGEQRLLRGTRLVCQTLLSEDQSVLRRSFLSNNHPNRPMDGDRFQYNEEERYLNAIADLHQHPQFRRALLETTVQRSLDSIRRMVVLEDGEGEQLVFSDSKTAYLSAVDYTRHNSEHWCEPVQDLVSDMLNLAERWFFVVDHPVARQFQKFYPEDYLHRSAAEMYELFAMVAVDDPVMKYLLDKTASIAAHQRGENETYDPTFNPYHGPQPPDGIKIIKLRNQDRINQQIAVINNKLVMTLPKGKIRTIFPRVLHKGKALRLDEIHRDYPDFIGNQHRWIGNYRAEVDLSDQDPELISALHRAVTMIEAAWPLALERPHMPPSELQRNIREANAYVLRRGAFIMKASAA